MCKCNKVKNHRIFIFFVSVYAESAINGGNNNQPYGFKEIFADNNVVLKYRYRYRCRY
jgi:hypothetical protein